MKQKSLVIVLIPIFVGLVFATRNQTRKFTQTDAQNEVLKNENCIPTFLDGGGPYYEPNTPFRTNIAPENNQGIQLTVQGKILAPDCTTPLKNLIVDVWQANESGNYEDEWYRGRVTSNENGEYEFTTVIPKGYGEGTAFRPPHIHFKIWNGNQLIITSQMFLPESRAQGIEEAYIMDVSKQTDTAYIGKHDIVLP